MPGFDINVFDGICEHDVRIMLRSWSGVRASSPCMASPTCWAPTATSSTTSFTTSASCFALPGSTNDMPSFDVNVINGICKHDVLDVLRSSSGARSGIPEQHVSDVLDSDSGVVYNISVRDARVVLRPWRR